MKDESLRQLCDELTRKCHTEFQGQRVQSGWIKYVWGDTIWNLDDGNALIGLLRRFVLTTFQIVTTRSLFSVIKHPPLRVRLKLRRAYRLPYTSEILPVNFLNHQHTEILRFTCFAFHSLRRPDPVHEQVSERNAPQRMRLPMNQAAL